VAAEPGRHIFRTFTCLPDKHMTPPALVYLGMGLLVARIILDGTRTRGFTWLQWLQFLFNAARLTLLWPLVLLIDKVMIWLKATAEVQPAPMPELERPVEKKVLEASGANEP
jgi:hypothetical protein